VSPNVEALSIINTDRVDGAGVPAFATNGFVDDYAQAMAVNFANCDGCSDPTNATWTADQVSTFTIGYATAVGGVVADRASRLATDFETFNHAAAFGTDDYASVGFYTKGTETYGVLVTVSFSSAPTNETRVGTVKLPSKIYVGKAIIPSIAGFTPVPTSDYTYTWLDGSNTVSNIRFFVPTAADLGHQLKLIVEDHNSGYSDGQVTSAASSKVLIGSATGPKTIVVEGARNVGEPLSINLNGWTPGIPKVQWYRNGAAIAGQTTDTYLQTTGDRGKKISVKLTMAAPGYVALSRLSSTAIVTGYPLLTSTPFPSISGSPSFGGILIANNGTWGPGIVKLTYQWRAEGKAIPGATKSTLTLGGAELNQSISVTVTGSETGYASTARTSSSTTDIRLLGFSATAAPSITGTLLPGHVVTATVGQWTPVATMYVFQWYLNNVAVAGANKSTFKLPTTSAGKDVSVNLIGLRPDYQPQQLRSTSWFIS
jgi:hypothetical protein